MLKSSFCCSSEGLSPTNGEGDRAAAAAPVSGTGRDSAQFRCSSSLPPDSAGQTKRPIPIQFLQARKKLQWALVPPGFCLFVFSFQNLLPPTYQVFNAKEDEGLNTTTAPQTACKWGMTPGPPSHSEDCWSGRVCWCTTGCRQRLQPKCLGALC